MLYTFTKPNSQLKQFFNHCLVYEHIHTTSQSHLNVTANLISSNEFMILTKMYILSTSTKKLVRTHTPLIGVILTVYVTPQVVMFEITHCMFLDILVHMYRVVSTLIVHYSFVSLFAHVSLVDDWLHNHGTNNHNLS